MHMHSIKRCFIALLAALLALSYAACSTPSDTTALPTPPTLDDNELPTPQEIPSYADDTPYQELAHQPFLHAAAAPAADFTYEKTADGIKLTSYTGSADVLILPDTIDGLPVTALGDALFKGNTTLTALSIPDSVQSVGKELLGGCRSLQILKTPIMGATRTSEQYLAYLFGGTSANLGAFKVGSVLDTVILTGDRTSLDAAAFYSCYRLIMVLLPDTVKEIGAYAFSGCSSLKYVNMPRDLTVIGDGAFSECTSLRAFTLPDSLERIGLGTFMGCKEMISLSLPFIGETRETNNHLGYLFGAQTYTWNADFIPASLREVTVRSGDVANYAFYECENLYAVTLPADCTSIGVRAFHGCHALLSLTIPDSVTHIADMAFSDCRWLQTIDLGTGVTEIGMQAFMGCINLCEISLPDGVTMLPPSLFANCKRLQTVTVSNTLTTVDDAAFRHCISLRSFTKQDGQIPTADTLAIGRDNAALLACLP